MLTKMLTLNLVRFRKYLTKFRNPSSSFHILFLQADTMMQVIKMLK